VGDSQGTSPNRRAGVVESKGGKIVSFFLSRSDRHGHVLGCLTTGAARQAIGNHTEGRSYSKNELREG
jgi:hypothetical protein